MTGAATPASGGRSDPGARWIDEFLSPLVDARWSADRHEPLRFLQIEPDDESEACRLRELGIECDVALLRPAGPPEEWRQRPQLARVDSIPVADGSYDLTMCGRFESLAANPAARTALSGEIARVCRPAGAFLGCFANGRCPLDLTRNGPLIHGPGRRSMMSMADVERLFVRRDGFASMTALSPRRHFGWGSMPAAIRWIGRALDLSWDTVVTPSSRWLYAGPLNPVLMLWMEKADGTAAPES